MRALAVISFALVACHREAPPAQSRAPAPSTDSARRVEPSKNLAPLMARLQYEARHRTGAPIPAERVLDDLDRAQLAVQERRQYVGATVRATYCMGGTTAAGVAVSVCEYPTAEAASAGKQFMDERFAAMKPQALRAVNRTTVLTVADERGATSPDASRALEVFAALAPQ